MATISTHRPQLFRFSRHEFRRDRRLKLRRIAASGKMSVDCNCKCSNRKRNEELSVQSPAPAIHEVVETSTQSNDSDLKFNRLQPSEQELVKVDRLEFGRFIAREAVLDEEFWTAAWLRAESHWEDRPDERYVDNFKRMFAEQEFVALKRRCTGSKGQKYTCIVTVKKEEKNVKRTVLKSVVGTLDLSIRHLLHGETYPGERVKAPLFCSINRKGHNRYGYVANLCVAKSARRQGIARNMLLFAIELAKSNGVEHVYVHVRRSNKPAQELYEKMGFEIVELASSHLLEEETYLLCFKM